MSENNEQITIQIPTRSLSSLKKEFNISEAELSSFIAALIERMIAEHVTDTNSKVFSEIEIKELEDDLKGLGYI